MNRKKIAIVGATSSMAEHCARLWCRQPVDVALVGRSLEKLERIAADLRTRSPRSNIEVHALDLLDPGAIQAFVQRFAQAQPADIALIAHGSLPDQAEGQGDLMACREALEVNAISPVLWAEAFAGKFAAAGRGTIAIVGSVAGDRGRRSNYIYGSAKGLVTRYAEGLRHRLASTAVKVVLVKPGPTDTPMTSHLKTTGAKLAPVEDVAADIVNAIDKGTPVVYTPGKWALIMFVIRNLPTFIFNKMNI